MIFNQFSVHRRNFFDRPSQMRFIMSTDEKKSSDVPSFVIAQPEVLHTVSYMIL